MSLGQTLADIGLTACFGILLRTLLALIFELQRDLRDCKNRRWKP